jgi:hypothetical protein
MECGAGSTANRPPHPAVGDERASAGLHLKQRRTVQTVRLVPPRRSRAGEPFHSRRRRGPSPSDRKRHRVPPVSAHHASGSLCRHLHTRRKHPCRTDPSRLLLGLPLMLLRLTNGRAAVRRRRLRLPPSPDSCNPGWST